MKRTALFTALALCVSFAQAQLDQPKPFEVKGARNLGLSPDGKRIAFCFRGDIWVAPTDGGLAVPITDHVDIDDFPCWSHDGKWIAFGSMRTGNYDIFVVPADGGSTRRLTWHTGSDIPSDWSPDDSKLIFRGTRDGADNAVYTIDVKTGQTKCLFYDIASLGNARMSPDGKQIMYTRFGYPWVRARYQGSNAAQVWTYDLATGKREAVRDTGFQNLWPRYSGDKKNLYTVTVSEKTPATTSLGQSIGKNTDNVARTPNLYRLDFNGRANRMTNFVGGSVRFPSTATNTDVVAFEYAGDIYTQAAGSEPKKVAIFANVDEKVNQQERIVLTTGAESAAMSPKGDKVAFVIRGEIWMVDTKRGRGPNADDAVQLTDWAGLDENPLWDKEGKNLYFLSDRSGDEQLFKLDVATKEVTQLTRFNNDVMLPRLMPDGNALTLRVAGTQGGIYTIGLDGGTPKRIVEAPGPQDYDADPDYDWSPDGRYIAYVSILPNSGFFPWTSTTNIFVKDTQSGKVVNITQLSAVQDSPRFSPDGKYLYFAGNRGGNGIFVVPLMPEDTPENELELSYRKPEGPVTTVIDFDGIATRIRRLVSTDPAGTPRGAAAGNVSVGNIRTSVATGEIFWINNGSIWKSSYSGEDARAVTSNVMTGAFELSADESQLVFAQGGAITTVNLKAPPLPVSTMKFSADWRRDLAKERAAAFYQFWRTFNRRFYDGNFHGRDWVAIRKRYEPMLEWVNNSFDFSVLLNEMVGELESSHSEINPAPVQGGPAESSAHPGFLIDYDYAGPGLRIKEVPKSTPGSYAKSKLSPGEYVMAINGIDVRADENLWRNVLNNQSGRELRLLVNSTPSKTGAREVKYRALNSQAWGAIIDTNRDAEARAKVEKESNGQLTYVRIEAMSTANLDQFNREFWEVAQGRKGIVIDVRGNGGGNISDQLMELLTRKPYGYYQPRDSQRITAPGQTTDLKMVVLHDQRSASNAEMFPAAMKASHTATLIGMPTPGYVIWTSPLNLVDGTRARMPNSGVYRLDGSPMENNGQQPDIKVNITPEDVYAGRDPQLEKAIEVLLGQIK